MSKKLFETVQMTRPGRSTFDLSHDVKMSMKFGELVPIMCTPVVPGDRFNIGCESLIRFAPMIAPIMHRVDATMHYFFVPYRLLWENFEKWIKGEKDPITNLPYAFPTISLQADGADYGRLADYMGIPNPAQSPQETAETISAMPFAAYQMIFNDYYRDQNLITEIDYKLNDGSNQTNFNNLMSIRKRAWMHDYFTSALPFAQKGEAVDIPLQGTVSLAPDAGLNSMIVRDSTGAPVSGTLEGAGVTGELQITGSGIDVQIDPNGNYIVNQGSATLNDLRIAMRVQEWLEKSARGGTRYNEFIMSQFGVRTSDARLQRPEYITGIKSPVTISEVLNTTGTVDAPQGQMAGHGVSVVNGRYGNYYAEEFGYIIGIMNVQPMTAYQQGIPKHFLKTTDPTEHYFPVFANLGEQEILSKELYAFSGEGNNIFGYIPRYAEYKYENNRVAGDFRTTLNFWHMGRIFGTTGAPLLNEQFVTCDATDRIFAVDDGTDYLWTHVYNKVKASRLMPFYGTPTF